MNTPEFVEWPSIPRLSRDMVITEKLDGTNAQVTILEDGQVWAGSRNRWIFPNGTVPGNKQTDNNGFAQWVKANEDELREGLGIGSHYGEWWGAGIQRKYGLTEKRFSLFNVGRWYDPKVEVGHPYFEQVDEKQKPVPSCCTTVPVLYRGPFDTAKVDDVLWYLKQYGSIAALGFMNPEGIVVFHTASGQVFKKTLDKNDKHKWDV